MALKKLDIKEDRSVLPPIHWVHNGDEGLDYCFSCAEKEVARLRKETPGEFFEVDGGMDPYHECDSPAMCHGCGQWLSCSIIEDAAMIETAEQWDAWGTEPDK